MWSTHYDRQLNAVHDAAIVKARGACAQSFTLWQQATVDIIRRNHTIIAC